MVNKEKPKKRIIKRQNKNNKKRLVILLSIMILAIFAVGGYAFHIITTAESTLADSHVEDEREDGKSDLRAGIVDPKFDNVSILIMGIDASDKRDNAASARTDALMLVTLNKESKSVKLLSIPRDSYVYIPEVGYETKINHAHAYGGEKATIDTVEHLLDIPVDYWIRVNFNSFIDVVDALNGITVDVPYEFSEQDSHDRANVIHLFAGEQLLDGEEALALARTRKLDNDIERGKRQQEIIKSIIKRTVSLSSILKYDDIIRAVGRNMTTNLSPTEIKSFISYGTNGINLDIESLTLEGHDYQPAGTYFWQLDEDELENTKQKLKRHLDISPGSTFTESYKSEEAGPNGSDNSSH